MYTELINRHISDPEQHLKVFDKNSVYLPTKKIGKNNPKADEIKGSVRNELFSQANLVSAIRLPNNLFTDLSLIHISMCIRDRP